MARDPVTRVPPRLSIAMCVFVCMNVSVCVCLYQGLGRIRSLSSLYSPIHTTTITYIVLYATYSATEHSSSPPLSLSLSFFLFLYLSLHPASSFLSESQGRLWSCLSITTRLLLSSPTSTATTTFSVSSCMPLSSRFSSIN